MRALQLEHRGHFILALPLKAAYVEKWSLRFLVKVLPDGREEVHDLSRSLAECLDSREDAIRVALAAGIRLVDERLGPEPGERDPKRAG